jgi:serine/threonine protein kinase
LNVIHRDIKPENILLGSSGQAKLADFGLSKGPSPLASSGNDTDAGMVLGTAAYMSPEQVRGEPLDSRSDLIAFGIVPRRCLCKRREDRYRSTRELARILARQWRWICPS